MNRPVAISWSLLVAVLSVATGCGPAPAHPPLHQQATEATHRDASGQVDLAGGEAHRDNPPNAIARISPPEDSVAANAPAPTPIDVARAEARRRQVERTTAARLDLAASRHAYTVHRCMPLPDAHRYACLAAAAERRDAEERAAMAADLIAREEVAGLH